MKRPPVSAALYVALVFLSGMAVGAFGHRLYVMNSVSASSLAARGPDDYRRAYEEEMHTRLRLNPSQVAQLRQVLDDTREKFRAFREKNRPELTAIQEGQVERINSFLNETQRAEYAKMREERDRQQRAHHNR